MPLFLKSSLVPTAISSGGSYIIGSQSNIQPTPIVITSATSTIAGSITLVWSGGIGTNSITNFSLSNGSVTVTGTTNSVSNGINTTTISLSTNNPITTTVTVTVNVLLGSTSATSASVTTPVAAMQPFTTINSYGSVTPMISSLSSTTYGSTSNVAVNRSQTKMLYSSNTGIWYATSSDSGATWTALTQLTSTNHSGGISMSDDGTRSVSSSNTDLVYISWTGSTPSAPVSVASSLSAQSCYITPNGNYAIFTRQNTETITSSWNGTTFNVSSTRIPYATFPAKNSAILTPNADYLIGGGNEQMFKSVPITWSGSTVTLGSVTQISTVTGDDAAIVGLGGGYSGSLKYLMVFCRSAANYGGTLIQTGESIYVGPYTAGSTANTWTLPTSTTNYIVTGLNVTGSQNSNQTVTPAGDKGNVIYFVENISNITNRYNISKIIINVT
jgi:hypothetical protein